MRLLAVRGLNVSLVTRSARARTFAALFVGIVLLQIAWAVALPIFRGPDEIEHVKRASGIAMGQILRDSGRGFAVSDRVAVETDVAAAQRDVCLQLHADFDPTICDPVEVAGDRAPADSSSVVMRSAAARYNPAWYLLVAPSSWLLEGPATVLGMRAIGAVSCALVLAWALWLHRLSDIRGHYDVGVMFCMTPAVVFASVVAAPNGLHLASALLFWVALLSPSIGPRKTWGLCVGGALMSLTHTLGLFWILCALIVFVSLRGIQHLRRIGRELSASPAALATLLSAQAFTVGWVVAARTNDPTGSGDVLADSTRTIPALAHGVVWVLQLVGTMPFRFGLLWPQVYALWIFAFAIFLWRAVRLANSKEKMAMTVAVALAVAIPTAVTLLTYEIHGYAWQGRYELPLLFGLPLVAGTITRDAGIGRVRRKAGYVLVTGVAVGLGTLCLALREESGVVAAACAVLLSASGWWLLWFGSYRVVHEQDAAGTTTSCAQS